MKNSESTNASRSALLDDLKTRWEQHPTASSKYICIANKKIKLEFQQRSLEELVMTSLENAKIPPQSTDLSIRIGQVDFTSLMDSYIKQYPAELQQTDGYFISKDRSIEFIGDCYESYCFTFDPDEACYYFCLEELPEKIPYHLSHPLRTIFETIFLKEEKYVFHGAVIGKEDYGILLAGWGGAGKSTTALSALAYGLDYIADDYFILTKEEHISAAYPIYSTGYLFPEVLDKLSVLKKNQLFVHKKRANKTLFDLRSLENQLLDKMPLQAIFLPKVANLDEPKIEKTAKIIPITSVVMSTAAQNLTLMNDRTAYIKGLLNCLTGLPAYTLFLSNDFEKNVAAIKDFIIQNKK